ncbi:MAG: ABC transporter substrate-binding protein [Chloroflexi bacterium]|nr:ABC transporter substrate-binding protein [Chloroflexota bacterium]
MSVVVWPVLTRLAFWAMMLGVVALMACTGSVQEPTGGDTPGPAAQPGQPKRGGTLVIPEDASKPSNDTDAHRGTASTNLNVSGNIHLPIIGEDTQNRGKIIGYLADSWEVSPDGKTYTIKVKELTTHKGKPFNAEDVAYNLNRFRTRPNKLPLARAGCVYELMDNAKAVDRTTVVITLQDRAPSFLACLGNPHIMIQPKYLLEEIDGPGKGRPVQPEEVDGVGPFKLVKWVDGAIIEMERFDSYYRQGLPYLDKLHSVQLPDPASVIAAFRTQRIQIFRKYATTPNKEEVDTLKAELGDRISTKAVVAPGATGFQLHSKRQPLDDIRVREAIDLAYNRQAYRDLINSGEGLLSGPYYCGWGWVFTCQELETWPGHRAQKTEDLKRANQLMQEAGYGPQTPLKLTVSCGTASPDSCDILREDLKKIGIDLAINRQEENVRRKQIEDQAFDIHAWIRIIPAGDPDDYHGLHYMPNAGENRAKWENPRYVELFKEQRRELDREKRAKILREMGKILYDDHVLLHGYGPMLHQTWWSFVKGYEPPGESLPHQTHYIADHIWLDQ